jgi:hypothetical protein
LVARDTGTAALTGTASNHAPSTTKVNTANHLLAFTNNLLIPKANTTGSLLRIAPPSSLCDDHGITLPCEARGCDKGCQMRHIIKEAPNFVEFIF